MSTTKRNMKVETLAWITDDEAEFWTSTSPLEKNNSTNYLSRTKTNKPVEVSSDGLYFKTKDKLETETEDHLSLLHEKKLDEQEKEKIDKKENTQPTVIFPSNDNIETNGNPPQQNMGFFDRLIHQLTRPSISETDSIEDEVFEEFDENEIKNVVNDKNNVNKTGNDGITSENNISILDTLRSFIDEITEETNVIIGTMDEETLFNRRSRKVKSDFSSSMKKNQIS